jgi:hypothetical protein
VWIPVEFPDEQDRVGLAALAAGPGAGEVLPEAVLNLLIDAASPQFLVEIVPILQQVASLHGTQDVKNQTRS